MPPPGAAGGFFSCFIHAAAQAAHAWSRHIGSLPPLGPAPVDGKQTHPFVPARSCFISPPSAAGKSMIVAFAEIPGGAALIALAIFCASVLPVLAAAATCSGCCARSNQGLQRRTTVSSRTVLSIDTSIVGTMRRGDRV